MKKIKIMFSVMIVFGSVGGVLAFEAKRVDKFCTTATVNGVCPVGATCPNGTIGKVSVIGAVKCAALTLNTNHCDDNTPACSVTARLTKN